jgi:hypothetical protein
MAEEADATANGKQEQDAARDEDSDATQDYIPLDDDPGHATDDGLEVRVFIHNITNFFLNSLEFAGAKCKGKIGSRAV